ncbi:MAG: quinolinate synthase NadA [Oscillospiraceae bacterium]|nr:quinolinate synthase NadA [Oscillospiraceae bacterium]
MSIPLNDLQRRILDLAQERGALILAHYYQPLEIQDAAHVVGDSFEMARQAKEAEEDMIVLCGVRFMAESAKILSPHKTILLPAPDAGCPMADMVEPEDVLALREKYPNAAVMCYVNSSAAVKAVSDVCCTSSSAVRIARQMDAEEIIFIPDRNLGRYVAEQVPEKTFYFHPGFCPIHDRVTADQAKQAKTRYPHAVFAVHPECQEAVLAEADFVGSTSQILDFARTTPAAEIIIGTELSIVERLRRELPEKKIFSVSAGFICPNMKKIQLEDLYNALEKGVYEIKLSEAEIHAAKTSLDRMVAL